MKQLLITRKLPEHMLNQLQPYYTITAWHDEALPPSNEFLIQQLAQADAMWTIVADKVDRDLIDAAPQLKIVTNMGVGYNNLDTAYLQKKGIMATNTPEVLNDATADLAFTLLLATTRRIPQNVEKIRRDEWDGWSAYFGAGQDVAHKTIGIIGMGKIGETLAKRATGFDMNILYYNRTRKLDAEAKYQAQYCSLEELLGRSDFVVIFAPLTEQTRNMITLQQLKLMKPTAVLINAARGGIVNEEDLYTALKEDIIWAAGSDVFEVEPITSTHPLITLDNFVGLPHIGSATIGTRDAMMQLNVDSLIAFAKGEEVPNRVI